MVFLAYLKRLRPVDATLTTWKDIEIPQGWELPDSLWVIVDRMEATRESWIRLCESAVALKQAASKYVDLVNNRSEFLFKDEEQPERWLSFYGPRDRETNRLSLTLNSGAMTGWDTAYFLARGEVDGAMQHFSQALKDAEFVRNMRYWCPPESVNRSELDWWYDETAEYLSFESIMWKDSTFTFRDIMAEMACQYPEAGIYADVLARSSGRDGSAVTIRREPVFDLRDAGIAPLRKQVWVSVGLAEDVGKAERASGPVV